MLFDEQFRYAGGGFSRVGGSGAVKSHWFSDAGLQNIAVKKNGYLYVYLSNESNVDVFFDNVQVIHSRGPLLEETHYYPFGLTMAGISSKAASSLENKLKFNDGTELQNKEFSDGSGLEFYNGSIVVLDIGESEFCLFVKCVWRLEQANTIITGWNESNDAVSGNMTKKIKELTGDIIKSVGVNNFFDLKLLFVSDKTFNVFCDVTPHYKPEDYDENWVICDIVENVSYVVNNRSLVVARPYE